ncbi:unnamed protein product [Ilex paraguariensis]|uniref:Protein kinase domain-containing protein n=1 Tax=Ilex paraguariensis TaxID=185542 RepID=A0ABC8R7P2_9AQUA
MARQHRDKYLLCTQLPSSAFATKQSTAPQVPGSNYLCNSKKLSCDTFIVYRAQEGYQNLSSISSLFDTDESLLRHYNPMAKNDSLTLQLGREIIVPVTCSCLKGFSQALYLYNVSQPDSLHTIACELFEGLVKAKSLIVHNPDFEENSPYNDLIQVPVRCACPETSETEKGIKFLVTYPLREQDHTGRIARKFEVPERMIWDANRLDPYTTIIPQTTILIPTMGVPVLNLDVSTLPGTPPPRSRPAIEIMPVTNSKNRNFSVYLGGVVVAGIVVMAITCGVLIITRKRRQRRNFKPLFIINSPLENFPPDFIDGMYKLKHSLISFSLEEMRIATENFRQACEIGTAVYRGKICGSYMAIEQMNSKEEAHHVIGILTKVNHLNIVKLEGCCYENTPYLVFEFAENGSLRDCLSNSKLSRQFTWTKRLQIAFDVAEGLHYIHHCTKPIYVHRNINSKLVLITKDWRAKISGFKSAKPLICNEEKVETNWNEAGIVGTNGYLAPEYLTYGQASTKVDVYAFGVVLLELLSAKEAIAEGIFVKNSLGFLADCGLEDSSECLEKFKGFMDPVLEGDYPFGDAVCLAVLAKGCVVEDPLHRPTMNDVLKALSSIL